MQSFDLTSEQQAAYCHIGAANNTFLTGRPGTGKSYLLKRIREEHGYDGGTIFVAPTGIVARALKCPTIHSFFELPCEPLMATEASPSQECLWRLRACDMLIVDEISMVRSDVFSEMDRRLRIAKQQDLPFGGIPVTVCGDFHQLPPVVEDQLLGESLRQTYGGIFAFETESWRKAGFRKIALTRPMRQADDPDFLTILNVIREDRPEIMEAIARLNRQIRPREEGIPVLCCRRAEVRAINQAKLQALPGQAVTFKAHLRRFAPYSEQMGKELHDLPCDEEITLKEGCEVMVLRNQAGSCVNGDRGVVEAWTDDAVSVRLQYNQQTALFQREEWPVLSYGLDENGKLEIQHVASAWQFPLAVGYATTIHKAQGMTLDRVHIDIGKGCWEPGQFYVAVSRVRRLADLTLEKEVGYFDVMPAGGMSQRLKSMGL